MEKENPCLILTHLYEQACKKDPKPATDWRLIPVIDELRSMNCLKTIQLGMELCKEIKSKTKN